MHRAGEQLKQWGEERLRRWGPWILAVLALLILLPGNNLIPLIDRDEPRFAQATREMMEGEHANWIVPYFNGNYRFDKPILIYWMMRASYAVFGINEFAARLPSVLCALALALLTFHIGKRWFNTITGFIAGFCLLTCVQLLLHGRSAVADMPMVICVLASQFALFEIFTEEKPSRWFWLFWCSVGVGFLAKGPVSLVIPALTLLFYRFAFWRQPLPWRRLRPELGIPIMLLIAGSWGIPALIATHGEFFRVGIGKHVMKRGFSSFEGHGMIAPYYYFATALFSLFPWIAFAGHAVSATRKHWNAKNAFLVSWIAATYLLFTCYLTKLPHYVLPAFPALFLLLGQTTSPEFRPSRRSILWFWSVCIFGLLLAAVITGIVLFLPWETELIGLRFLLISIGGMIIALLLTASHWNTGKLQSSFTPLIGLIVSIITFGMALRMITPAVALRFVLKDLPADTQCASWRFDEPSLVFYGGRHWDALKQLDDVKNFLSAPGPRLVICREQAIRIGDYWKMYRSLPARPRSYAADLDQLNAPGVSFLSLSGLDIAVMSWMHLRVYYRNSNAAPPALAPAR